MEGRIQEGTKLEERGLEGIKILKPHIGILVRDLGASMEFYRKLFGIDPVKVRTGYAKFDVANPPLNFTLNEAGAEVGRGALSHMGLQVSSSEEVMAIRASWEQAGLSPRDEMGTDCCYAIQDKAWVSDPDGNEWEVFVVLKDQLPEKQAQGVCCAPQATVQIGSCSTT